MQRKTKITAIATIGVVLCLGALAVFAAPQIYRVFFAPEAEAPPTLSADDTSLDPQAAGTAIDAAALDGTWTIADGSHAGYRVDEVLEGDDVTVTGTTDQVSGSLTVSDLTITEAKLSVDVASIATDSANRDAYFRETAMRADEHPTATFELTEPMRAEQAPAAGEQTTFTLTGDLTLAGETKQVDVVVEAATDGDSVELAGRIPITFADFGVEAPDLGFVQVAPDGFVEFKLIADRDAA